jgi:hypothetical protein|tara:strand:- start:6511 stop:7107 length:597 start_codon:yes stop_codon:yes gene_type:complete
MYIRPPLEFDVIRPKVKYYFHFDIETGDVFGCSVQHQGHSVEITKELADGIHNGTKELTDYRVVFKNTEYVVESLFVENNKLQNDVKTDDHINKVIYEIGKNDTDSCVRFVLDMKNKKWNISIDDELKNVIQNTVTQDNFIFKFFTTPKNNTSVPEYSFEVDMTQLCAVGNVQIDHNSNQIPRLFCRKVYNYSYEVTQ